MARYAAETTVPVERSRAEIEGHLIRYGATEFQSGWKPGAAMVGFRIRDISVRFVLPVPDISEKRFTHRKVRGQVVKANEAQQRKAWEQEVRQRWPCSHWS